jgi:pantoate--beta-alanine ligase
MAAWSAAQLGSGRRIALVPTMGFFHEGHLHLMRHAAEFADLVVVSLFVNPIQFGPGEDLDRYPRDLDQDIFLAGQEKVAVLFVPDQKEMYPESPATRVTVSGLTTALCGRTRPGHFDGVCTVVAKLFNIVKPAVAVFGSKDYQQLAVVRRMTVDLSWDTEIVAHPIVRAKDGLAMSSRNVYLSSAERESALSLPRAVVAARARVRDGVRDAQLLLAELAALISGHDNVEIEYLAIVDRHDLTAQSAIDDNSLLAMAVRVGKTRLIDNTLLLEKNGVN